MDQNEPQMRKKIKLNNSSGKEAPQKVESEHKKPSFIESIKKDLQFLIRHKVQDSKQKQTRALQVYEKIQGILFQIAHSRVGGRIVQLIIKCADERLRNRIFDQLLGNEQQFSEILKSKYAHFVGITMIRNIPHQFKNSFFSQLYKEAFQYVAHKDAGLVLNRFLLKCASPHQINLIKQLFSEKSQKEDKNQTIENLAIKIIEKQMHNSILAMHILNLALPQLVPAELQKVLQYFTVLENHDYLHLKEGAQVKQFFIDDQFFCSLINVCDTKNRKLILRNISQTLPSEFYDKNDYFHIALIKLFHSIDDTKILNKLISSKILANLSQLIQTKKGQSILFSLFISQHNELTSFEKTKIQNNYRF